MTIMYFRIQKSITRNGIIVVIIIFEDLEIIEGIHDKGKSVIWQYVKYSVI